MVFLENSQAGWFPWLGPFCTDIRGHNRPHHDMRIFVAIHVDIRAMQN
jgi:hypothetical protein